MKAMANPALFVKYAKEDGDPLRLRLRSHRLSEQYWAGRATRPPEFLVPGKATESLALGSIPLLMQREWEEPGRGKKRR